MHCPGIFVEFSDTCGALQYFVSIMVNQNLIHPVFIQCNRYYNSVAQETKRKETEGVEGVREKAEKIGNQFQKFTCINYSSLL